MSPLYYNDQDNSCYDFNRYGIILSTIRNITFSQINPNNGVHRHSCYEVCFVSEGSGYFVCGNTSYTVAQNSIFIVSPNVDHEISCGERGWLKLWFYAFLITATPNTQGELTEQDRIIRDFIRQHHAVADHCEFLTSYAEFEQSYSRKGGSYGLKDVALTMLLDCIQMFCTYRTREIVKTDNPLANKIVSFISSNVQLNVGIDEICNHVNVSQRTLFLLFKKYFKTSPIQYINTEKISTSIGYLKMGFDIKTIAELMGFTELSSFSRLFKKMTGLSPRSYLSKYNANAE